MVWAIAVTAITDVATAQMQRDPTDATDRTPIHGVIVPLPALLR